MSNRRKLWTPGGKSAPKQVEPEVRELKGEGPELRLVVCRDCKSIEELPPYTGPVQRDILLEDTLSRHMTEWSTHEVALIKVPESYWKNDKVRERLIQQISKGGSKGIEELDAAAEMDYYAAKDNYREDALRCFNRHQRPKEGCIDWHNPDKRIGNPTSEGWKTGPRVYACDFCPVASWVAKKKQEEAGV